MRLPESFGRIVTVALAQVRAPQADQTVNVPWFLTVLLVPGAFLLTWFRIETALPLILLATAMNRYRFDFAGAGLRIEHFVCLGVGLAWFLRVRPGWKLLGFSRADVILAGYLGLALVASLLYAPMVRESLKFFVLMGFGVGLYWLVRAIALRDEEFARGVVALIVVGVAASLFGIAAWLAYPLGVDLGVQVYALDNFRTHSPFGTLFDSNTLGLYAMAATLLQVTLLVDAQFARWRGWLAAGIVIGLIAVALSLTRAAWVGLVVGLFLVLLTSPRRRLALAVGGIAVALVVVALVANSALAGGGAARWQSFRLHGC